MNQQLPITTVPSVPTPGIQNFQINQPVINPTDGKSYVVQQSTPGKGVTLKDPTTQQQVLVSEQDSQTLQPTIKTTALEEALDNAIYGRKEQKGDNKISITELAKEIVSNLVEGEMPEIVVKRNFKSAAKFTEESKMKSKRWFERRKELKTQSDMENKELQNMPTYNEKRQVRAVRELGLSKEAKSMKPDVDSTGHDKKTGLPIGEEKEIEVGLTEFPKDVDRSKHPEGYNSMTMEEMDHKFEDEHEHFDNESKLPSNTMMREESGEYYSGDKKRKKIKDMRAESDEPRYSHPQGDIYKSNPKISAIDLALDKVIGIEKTAEEEGVKEPEKLPVQYKPIKKAPGKDMGYIEPDTIPQAGGEIKEAIKKFKDTQKSIETLQEQIKIVSKPLQEALLNATKPLNEEILKHNSVINSYLNLVYDKLGETKDKIAAYEDNLFTSLDRENVKAPPASLAEILKKAKEINPAIAEEIQKIKSLIENDNTKAVIERYLYEYPISEIQKKKISSLEDIDSLLHQFVDVINSLQSLNSTF